MSARAPLEVRIPSKGHGSAYDVRLAIEAKIPTLRRRSGLLRACVVASSAALTIMRYEPGTVRDLFQVLGEIAPTERDWQHEQTTGDPNGYAHVCSSLIGTHVVAPFDDGRLALPESHRIVLLDFDPRESERRILLDV